MRETENERTTFAEQGFLLRHGQFSAAEIEELREGAKELLSGSEERLVRERDGVTLRSAYGIHSDEAVFSRLARSARLVEPTRGLLGGEVYLYQSKLNVKRPFVGDRWEWHQDYAFWRAEDAMLAPQVLTAAVYLDDLDEFNGPLVVIPGSHRQGLVECSPRASSVEGDELSGYTSASLKHTVSREQVARLVGRGGLVAPKGRAGAVLFFSGCLVHASGVNLSPSPRSLALYTYNRVDNAPARAPRRPWFLQGRDVSPVEPVYGPLTGAEDRGAGGARPVEVGREREREHRGS